MPREPSMAGIERPAAMTGISHSTRAMHVFAVGMSLLLSCLPGLVTVAASAEREATQTVPKASGSFLGYKTAIQIGLEQHPLVKKSQASALAAGAVTQQ